MHSVIFLVSFAGGTYAMALFIKWVLAPLLAPIRRP